VRTTTAQTPTHGQGASENRVAASATTHCLTGCVIGEVAGMAIGTAASLGDVVTVTLAVALAFIFGYALTALPLVRAGLPLGAVASIALASDTISIAIMEAIDNAAMVLVPGALEAGLADALFWGTLFGGFAAAYPVAFVANRALIRRGKGHALVHEHHGGH
jgi:hypothetical protein